MSVRIGRPANQPSHGLGLLPAKLHILDVGHFQAGPLVLLNKACRACTSSLEGVDVQEVEALLLPCPTQQARVSNAVNNQTSIITL